MKNYLTLVLALSVVSSPAFASRARLESLGEGKNGSYYIDDSRNFFLNPAQLSHYKKKLFLEFGGEPNGVDTALAPRGQGGFTNTFGDFTYALYLNQTSERTLALINQINTAIAGTFGANYFTSPDSQIDFLISGNAGSTAWGLGVFFAGNDTQAAAAAAKKATLVGIRAGVEMDKLQVFASVGIIGKSNVENATAANANDEIKSKIGIDAGVTYGMDDMTVFGKVLMTGADLKLPAAAVTSEIKNTQYGIGAGWKKAMTKSATMFTRVEADYTKVDSSGQATNTYNVPLVFGAEAAALSWLTLRGSVAASLLGVQWTGTTRNSLAGSTTVTAGTGLTFGEVQIDALLGMGAETNAGANGFGTNPRTPVNNWGLGDNMFTRLAMTYNF